MPKIHPDPSTDSNVEDGFFHPPRMDLAIEFRNQRHPRWRTESGELKEFSMTDSPKKLASLGVGVTLYFETIRFLAILFFVMFVISLPSMIMMSFLANKDFTNTESLTEKLKIITISSLFDNSTTISTVGNDIAGCTDDECHVCPTSKYCAHLNKETIAIVISSLDCLYTIVFLLAVFIFTRVQNRRVTVINDTTTTSSDYTVMVEDIPQNVEHAGEVLEFFSKYGTVVGVAIGRSNSNLIRTFQRRSAHIKRKERILAEIARGKNREKKLAKCDAEISKCDAKLKELSSDTKVAASYVAFVTFNEGKSAVACLKDYQRLSIFGAPAHMRFRYKHSIKVSRAPEPSDILWENLEYGRFSQFLRRGFSAFFSLLLLAITLFIVVASKNFKQQQSSGEELCSTASVVNQCQSTLSKTMTDVQYQSLITTVEHMTTNSSLCATCICKSLLVSNPEFYSKSVEISLIGWHAVYGTKGFCTEEAKSLAIFYSLTVLSIIVVVVINFAAKFLMKALAKFERHHFVSYEEAATAISIFLMQFCNTGLIILVVNAQIPSVQQGLTHSSSANPEVGSQVIRLFPVFAGLYQDFNADWYAVVGTALMVTIMLNVIIPIVPVLLVPFQRCLNACTRWKHSTQTDLNEAMMGPEFAISDRYGLVLSTVFVCTMYSAGMPLMLLLASFTFIVIYWVEKFFLLRVCRNPPQYDDTMDRRVRGVLPWASLLHVGLALWVYSVKGIPQAALTESIKKYSETVLNKSQTDSFIATYNVVGRILNWVVFPIFILLIIDVIYLFLPKLLFFIPSCKSVRLEEEDMPVYREAAKKIVGIKSYQMSDNPKYSHVILTDNSAWMEEKFDNDV